MIKYCNCIAGETKPINTAARKLFRPVNSPITSNADVPNIEGLIGSLYGSCPDSCAFQYIEFLNAPNPHPDVAMNEEFYVSDEVEIITTSAVPPTCMHIMSKCANVDEFFSVNHTEGEVIALERHTIGQATNSAWARYRKGIITASNIHSVYTKM